MAEIQTSTWSETAASNNAATPDGWPEGQAPSTVNDCAREDMAALKREWNRSHPTLSSSGTNTVTLTYTTAPTAYVQGLCFSFVVATTNTAATTLNVNALGAKNVFSDGAITTGGEFQAGQIVTVFYDGTQFNIVSNRPAQDMAWGFRNLLINGGMEVWQRGAGGSASFAVAASTPKYVADHWFFTNGANQACVVSQNAGLTGLASSAGSLWALKVIRNNAQTGTGTLIIQQPFTLDQLCFSLGSIVTLSVTMKCGANYSPTSSILAVKLYCGTGAAGQRGGSAYTNETSPIAVSQVITTSATRYTFVSTAIPTNTTQMAVQFEMSPTGTAGADDSFYLDDVQLEIDGIPSLFERRPFDVELAQCQRFFWKTFPYATAPAQNGGTTGSLQVAQLRGASLSQVLFQSITLPVRMRIAGTGTTYNPSAANAQVRDNTVSADCTVTTIAPTEYGFSISATTAAGGASADQNLVHASIDADL